MASGARRAAALSLASIALAGGLAAVAWAMSRDSGEPEAPRAQFEPGDEPTVRGVVVENSVDPCLFPEDHQEPCVTDGGEFLLLDVDGAAVKVHYGGGEWPPCDNVEALRQGEQARVDTQVEVFARAPEEEGPVGADLDTCPDSRYYIRVLQ